MERDELITKFSKHEVETAEEIIQCLKGPPTADKFRRMLLLFLRGHYSSSDNFMGFDQLDCFTWDPDPAKVKLHIEFTHQDDDANPDAYPGIYIAFARNDFSRMGIGGNFAANTQDLSGTHISKEATVTFLINHVTERASDAYDLAELSSRALTSMATPLALNAKASGFEVLGYGLPKEKNPSPEKYYTVAMPVQIKYTLAVTRSLESHRIRLITQMLTAQS